MDHVPATYEWVTFPPHMNKSWTWVTCKWVTDAVVPRILYVSHVPTTHECITNLSNTRGIGSRVTQIECVIRVMSHRVMSRTWESRTCRIRVDRQQGHSYRARSLLYHMMLHRVMSHNWVTNLSNTRGAGSGVTQSEHCSLVNYMIHVTSSHVTYLSHEPVEYVWCRQRDHAERALQPRRLMGHLGLDMSEVAAKISMCIYVRMFIYV